ncbi:hypothetical protein HFO15_01710 [Rhizobium laguerreae]|uniref:hypothetical protein n=1 Tax=Rhizobium laguerreae TaxID=1076926 RepID=UPI001C9258F7|nr:hypothetical protein [Rhizobium laguerreae]MBY3260383.1 hypothetical protein [Rhizobium laguerreae]MBY3335691.1 hypothetical protein [Rhizobium laguerreae]
MIESLKKNLRAGTTAGLVLLGSVGGWFANQYMDYRSAYREALSANYQAFNSASSEIQESLREFADIARGTKKKSPDDVKQLQTRLLKALGAASDLQRRLDNLQGLAEYETATINLKHASDKITGPVDAKPLVVAVSDYLIAEKHLRDAVFKESNAFVSEDIGS